MSAIIKTFTSASIAAVAHNTVSSVGVQTGLKAAGRPLFIMNDKTVDSSTKKFAATKEFLYQAVCFGVFIAMLPLAKKGAFKLYKNIFKNEHGFNKFKSLNQYDTYTKIIKEPLESRISHINSNKKTKKIFSGMSDEIKLDITTKENPEKYNVINGSTEGTILAASMVGFGVVAPVVSGKIVRPIMNLFSKKEKS